MPNVVSLTPSPQRPGLLKQRDGRGRTDGFANAVSGEAGCHNQGAKSWERKQQQPNLDFFTPSTENCAGCVLLSIKELIQNYLLVRDSDIQIKKMTFCALTDRRVLR